jgi:hypothetical protein
MAMSKALAATLAQSALLGEIEKKHEREVDKLSDMVVALTDEDFREYMRLT